jgi:hypothetical protein
MAGLVKRPGKLQDLPGQQRLSQTVVRQYWASVDRAQPERRADGAIAHKSVGQAMISRERTRLGLTLLSLVVAGDIAWYVWETIAHQPSASYIDRVTAYERRLAPIRSQLPHTGIVGYTIIRSRKRAEWAPYGRVFTQYALVPLLVDNARPHRVSLVDAEDGFRVIRENRR